MMKLWLRAFLGPKTVLVPPNAPLDFNQASCEDYGQSTLVEVDASEARYDVTYPVRLKEGERPGSVKIVQRSTGQLLHSIAPPSAVGPRGLEIGALIFAVYVKPAPGDVLVFMDGGIEKYATVKVKITDTRK
jgi:hypothetical protein